MKILIATGIYPPDIGGPATYSSLLVKKFPKRGLDVEVVTYGPTGISRKIPKGVRHLLYFFVCFFKALRSDVIFAQNQLSAGLPAMLVAKITSRKFIIRIAGDSVWERAVHKQGVEEGINDFQGKKYGAWIELRKKIQRCVVGNADAIITPSIYFKKIVSGWVKNPDKIYVIYNGIELVKPKKFTKKKDKTIFSAGRLAPWKGFDFLVELMVDLPDWQLIIIGDGPMREKLEKLIDELNLKKRVRLTGFMPREKLLKYLDEARVFVLNTSFESFSFQIVEAMNAGVPVVTTNIGNLPEIIDDGQEGILVEPNNKKQIIEAIEKIEEDNNFRKTIIKNAQKKAQKFSLENMLNNLEKLLKSL